MLLIARAILRRRWAALVALGMIAGITGATVTSAFALARRSGTAYDRLEAQTAPGDVTMLVPAGADAAEQVVSLPGVDEAWIAHGGVAAVGDTTNYVGITAGPPPPPGLFRPIPIEGRLPKPDAANEVVIAESLVDELRAELGQDVGARIPLHFLTPEEFRAFDVGFGAPDGPAIEVTVVGVARVAGPERFFTLLGGPGFAAAHPDAVSVAPMIQIALERGAAGVPAFLARLERLETELAPPAGGEEFQAFEVEVSTEGRAAVDSTASTLVTGLAVFAAVAGVTGLLVVGQAFARYHALTAHEQRTEAALGLTRIQRAWSRTLATTLSAGLAAAVTAGGTVLVGSGNPIGALSAYEPNPGRSVNVALIAVGSAIAAFVVLATAGGTAWIAGRLQPVVRRWWRPRWVDRLSARPAAVGVRFAIGAGPGAAARAARIGIAGLIVGIVGIVGALTFDASLTRLVDTPARYGWSGDFAIVDTRPDIDQEVLEDRRVAAATRYRSSTTSVGGVPGTVDVNSFEYLQGQAGWWIVDGREPRADDEVMVGLRLADDLGLEVGDTVSLGGSRRPERDPVTVVGTGVEPPLGDHEFGSVLLMTPAGFDRFAQTDPFTQTLVRTDPRSEADAVRDHFGSSYELTEQALPRDVDNLRQLERLPALLGGFIALIGFAMLAHAMVIAVRRRSHDFAVLRAVGYTPGQTAFAVTTMAIVVVAIALAVGVPVGIGAGRLLWQLVARDASVEGDALVPLLRMFAISSGALVVAVLVAAVPARRAATVAPATLLRAE